MYLPEQDPKFLDAKELVAVKEMGSFESYKAGRVLGFVAYKFGDDYALVSDKKELLVGDNATADSSGNVILMPSWLPSSEPYSDPQALSKKDMDTIKKEFKRIVKKTGAASLLSSHRTSHSEIYRLRQKVSETTVLKDGSCILMVSLRQLDED